MGAFFGGLAGMLILLSITTVSLAQLQTGLGQHERPSGVRLHETSAD
jgi:hypothetical protein